MIDLTLNKASTNTFTLVIPRVAAVDFQTEGMKELFLNITGSVIPSISLENIDYPAMGGRIKTITGAVDFGEWNVNFIVDEKLSNWRFLYNWMMAINNNNDQYVGEDHYIDATLFVYDNYKNPQLSMKVRDLWPNSLSEIVYTYREGETYLECTASFTYNRFDILDAT